MNTEIMEGGMHTDARGALRFCNDFDMSSVKRFYTIANSAEQPVRGWIGHKRETKWFFPLKGTTTITLEQMDGETLAATTSAKAPAVKKNAEDAKDVFVLEEVKPSVLKVPPGNWFCIKQDGNAEVMVFSDCKVGEFKDDDFRRPFE